MVGRGGGGHADSERKENTHQGSISGSVTKSLFYSNLNKQDFENWQRKVLVEKKYISTNMSDIDEIVKPGPNCMDPFKRTFLLYSFIP